jgi:hypothetical protein
MTWNNPVLSGPYLLVRNNKEAVCYEMPIEKSERWNEGILSDVAADPQESNADVNRNLLRVSSRSKDNLRARSIFSWRLRRLEDI